jgi:hypothetical protein
MLCCEGELPPSFLTLLALTLLLLLLLPGCMNSESRSSSKQTHAGSPAAAALPLQAAD